MARPPRLEFPGAIYHVIVRGNERRPIFRDDDDRRQYLARLAHYRERYGFRLLAFCLMGNHAHLAMRTGRFPLSRVMAGLQSSYTQWFNRRYKRSGHLFQGRYKALLVQEDPYLRVLVRYIHENPIEAKLATKGRPFDWSSDRYYRQGHGPEWLDQDDFLAMLGPTRVKAARAYEDLMTRGVGLRYDEVATVGQVVKGEEAFAVQRFEEARQMEPQLRGVSERRLLEAVGAVLSLPAAELKSPARRRDLSEGRAIAGYVGKKLAGISMSRMARYLHRDGSTLVRDVGYLEKRMEREPRLRRRVTAVVRSLRGWRK